MNKIGVLLFLCLAGLSAQAQLQILSASFGANCGVMQGNATNDVFNSCRDPNYCSYQVSLQRLGDPAYGCRKDFRVQYSCNRMQPQEVYLPGPAEGQTAVISCAGNSSWPPRPPPQFRGIEIQSATYGGNCRVPFGNVTYDVADTCNGNNRCSYIVSTDYLRDPARGCPKDFRIDYSCNGNFQPPVYVNGESDGAKLNLSCGKNFPRPREFGLQIYSATYGANCGAYRGNVSNDVSDSCSGNNQCKYLVLTKHLGDPVRGCRKDFSIEYSCGRGPVQTAYVGGEANGQKLNLNCFR